MCESARFFWKKSVFFGNFLEFLGIVVFGLFLGVEKSREEIKKIESWKLKVENERKKDSHENAQKTQKYLIPPRRQGAKVPRCKVKIKEKKEFTTKYTKNTKKDGHEKA